MPFKDKFAKKIAAADADRSSGQRAKLPTTRIDSDKLPPFVRFSLFRRRASKTFDVSLHMEPKERFRVLGQVWFFGDICVGAVETFSGMKFDRTGRHIERTASDQCNIVLFHSGVVAGEADGVPVVASSGDVLLIDRSRPIKFSVSRTRVTVLLVRRDRIAALMPGGELPHGHVLSGAAGALLADFMRSLERQSADVTMDEASHIERAACEVIAAGVAPSRERLLRGNAQLEQSWRIEAKRMIDRELHDSALGPEDVAKRLGLSRSALYRLFEADKGGVSAFIRRRRLRAACRLFLDPDERRRISEIAFACGFKSESHFSRAFREEFQLSPSAYREMRGAASLQPHEGEAATSADIVHHWLAQMD